MPATSRLHTKLRDTVEVDPADPNDPVRFGPWSTLNYQLATLTDAVVRVQEAVLATAGQQVKPTDPMPRPQVRTRRKDDASLDQAIALLEGIREEHRREVAQA